MREIARRAGVSSATVSRVINGSTAVREDTAQRVRSILEEVQFIPNPSATTLKYGRSKTYGLIVPDMVNPFFAEFFGEFEDLLIGIDHEVLLTSAHTSEKLLKSIRRMLMRQVDGAVLMASEFDTKSVEPLLRRRVPLTTVDRRTVHAGCSDVSIDYELGFAEAVRHLVSLGHTRIGYIGGMKGPHTSEVRANAFKRAIRDAGLRVHPEWMREGNYRVSGGEREVTALMKEAETPTAILTANDLTALGAAQGLHRMGMSAPHDLSVVGCDDIFLSEVSQPPLSTVRTPRKRLAKACIEALDFSKANIESQGIQLSVPTELIVRETTAPPKRKEVTGRTSRRKS
ncbi:MAG: LacI family DNA-binding transcriptional regulator [Terriglobus sp.]